MPSAARVGDITAHGTPLSGSSGSPDVLISGKPAWRAAIDFHSCPLSSGPRPHVGGVVTVGSSTVLINGQPAARQGDIIAENGPPNTIISGDATVLIGGGSAPTEPPWATSLYEKLSSYIGKYNQELEKTDLGIIGTQFRNERVDLYVSSDDGEAVFSFRTDRNNRIEEFQRGTQEDATIRMETDRATINRVTNAESPSTAFRNAVTNDDIVIQGIGLIQEMKWRVLNGVKDLVE